MKLSIIIPTYNRKFKLLYCLKSLIQQSYNKEKYEIIVVDDGSTDDTEKEVKKFILENKSYIIKYIKQKHLGPASARNIGILKAKGEYIIFLNDDIIPEKNLLKEHIKFHNDKNIAIIGNIIFHEKIKVTPFMLYASLYGYQFAYGIIKDPDKLDYNFFYTANLSVNKKLLEKDLFDENFIFPACEDSELGYRLQRRGLNIIFNKKAIVYHNHFFTFREFCKRQVIVGKSLRYLFEKWPKLSSKMDFYSGLNSVNKNVLYIKIIYPIMLLFSSIVSFLDKRNIKFSHNFYDSILKYYTSLGLYS